MKQLIGKKIKVKINDRNLTGAVIPNQFTTIVGICTFAGYNEVLEDWQITVDRTPIFPIQFKDISIID